MQSVKKALVRLFCSLIPSRQLRRKVRNDMFVRIKGSEERKNFLISKLPILEYSQPSGAKLKVAIWGTNEESKFIFLMLTHSPEWEVDIDCFIDDNGMDNLYGIPVKKLGDLNSTVTQIVIENTVKASDGISKYFDQMQPKLSVLGIRHLFIILPDPNSGRLDSPQWQPLLGKEVVIYSDNDAGERLARLIESLNDVFRYAFDETIHVSQVVEDIEQAVSCLSRDQKILIAQEPYSDTIAKLLASGKSLNDILVVRYADSQVTPDDMFMKDGDVLVYTMPKVGSVTCNVSLKSYGISTKKTHHISRTPLQDRRRGRLGIDNDMVPTPWGLIESVYIYNYVSKNLHREKLHVITGARNPLERGLSVFFHEFNVLCELKSRQIPDQPEDLYSEITERIQRDFAGEVYFFNKFKQNLHVDVYQYPFDFSKGYQIIEEDNVRLLIIRLENLNEVWEKAVTEWLGEERLSGKSITLQRANEAATKPIANLYKEVSSRIKFAPAFIEEIYSTQYAKHFYSEDELFRFKQKWLDR